jgi:hypothetical protein
MEPETQPELADSELIHLRPGADALPERNWLAPAIAAALAVVIVVGLVLAGHARRADQASVSSAPDPYAANLAISGLTMSESSNLAGGKVTYLDGQIANHGGRMVTGVSVEVIFRDYKNEVAQSQRIPLTVIRMREPYIDTAPLTVVPLKPGAQQDFRLNFDAVSPDWAGALPEVHVVHVYTR